MNKRAILFGFLILHAIIARAQESPGQSAGDEAPLATAPSSPPPIAAEQPRPELERPTVWGEPTEVQIGIFVIDVDEVNSANQSFAASVYYEARWKNPFMRHPGPGPVIRGITEVWTPRLTIVSQQMAWESFPESVEIEPDGTVIYRQKVWGRFSQPLDLRRFPFDRQTLSIHIVAAGLLQEHVNMVPLVRQHVSTSGIAQKFSLPDFDILSAEAAPEPYFPVPTHPGLAGYEMQIHLARQKTYYILKVIVPLCLIVIMSWLPRWIAPDSISTSIGISTTAFLTLIAYLFAIGVVLPPVSYITRMDRFIFLSTIMVFASLMQTVANARWIDDFKNTRVEWLDRMSRYLYPAMLLLVLVVSFVV